MQTNDPGPPPTPNRPLPPRAEAATPTPLSAAPASKDLYRTSSPQTLLAAARTLITEDTIATLITVDPAGQPRARSILVSPPDDDLTLWMATRPGSRKLDQLRANPTATLHFAEDSKAAYLSLMGTARIHSDPATIQSQNPYKSPALAHFFPHFPPPTSSSSASNPNGSS